MLLDGFIIFCINIFFSFCFFILCFLNGNCLGYCLIGLVGLVLIVCWIKFVFFRLLEDVVKIFWNFMSSFFNFRDFLKFKCLVLWVIRLIRCLGKLEVVLVEVVGGLVIL